MKTAAFTVRASLEQSNRWRRAADAEGHVAVGSWLAAAADAYLKVRARAGLPVPLAWSRGRFMVDGREVRGKISHPFATYRVRPGLDLHALIYLPTGRLIATLAYQAHCKALAAELARTWVRWGGSEPAEDPAPLLQRFQREDV